MRYFVSHGQEVDQLAEMAASGRPGLWTVNPNVQAGDRVILYAKSPHSAFVALATVTGRRTVDGAKYRWSGKRMASIRVDRMIHPAVHIRHLRKRFPRWAWLKSPIAEVEVPAELQRPLMAMLRAGGRASAAPSAEAAKVTVTGGGFGDAEMNRRVERAAVRHVMRHFKREGWAIDDRQRDKCGYDLHATRGRQELHLEVKGTRGDEPGFILTANEEACAAADGAFRLCIVTSALSNRPRLEILTVRQVKTRFELLPLAYIAKPLSH